MRNVRTWQRGLRSGSVLVAAIVAAGLSGCSGGSLLGQEKRSPDEFAVYSRAPLSLPPGYNLRPPEPGSADIDPLGGPTEARSALIGDPSAVGGGYSGAVAGSAAYAGVPTGGVSPTTAYGAYGTGADPGLSPSPIDPTSPYLAPGAGSTSIGVQAMLDKTGGNDSDPKIRDLVNRETAILSEEDISFVESLMFWGTPTEYGTVVDPVGERRRIKENQALGRPVTAGTTPTIERKQRALLQGIFD